ncbi:MAG TPA: hypothetical protein VGQ84_11245 [Gaiellaceae bacterium]|nr:hypothetical protein [Gaiellaceae bacterium]
MELGQELERIATLAAAHADAGEDVVGVLAAEAEPGERVYLCAFARGDRRSWLALDAAGGALVDRARLRAAVGILALCELAEENAGGGDLGELRAQLVALRVTENPPGIDEAEEAALALENVVGAPPRLATPAHLDAVGAATRRLERALGDGGSPFANAMQYSLGAVEELTREVESAYKRPLT